MVDLGARFDGAVPDDIPLVGFLQPLITPLRFSIVAQSMDASLDGLLSPQSIYKGGFPRRRNLPFLSRLKLRTIVSLIPKPLEALDKDVCDWATQNGVTLAHIRCEKPKEDGGGLSPPAAAKALLVRRERHKLRRFTDHLLRPTIPPLHQHLLDSRQLPLYVHCLDGQSVSTLLIGVLRRVQAWSSKATTDEIVRSLGEDDEVITYMRSFLEKFGKPEGVRLPPRRFLPEWIWSDFSPLRRLRDPYDVINPRPRVLDRSAPHSGTSSSNGLSLSSQSQSHRRFESNEGSFAAASGGSTAQNSPSTNTYGVGALPVQHPFIKLRFDADPDLPPPLHMAPSTPSHSRDTSSLLSPSPSRPSSRAGRTSTYATPVHSYLHHSEAVRAASRPGSGQASPRKSMPQSPNLEWTAVLGGGGGAAAAAAVDLHSVGGLREIDGDSREFTDGFRSGRASPITDQNRAASISRDGSLLESSSTPTKSALQSHTSTPRASVSMHQSARTSPLQGRLRGLGLQQQEGASGGTVTRTKELPHEQGGEIPSTSTSDTKDREDLTPLGSSKDEYFPRRLHNIVGGEMSSYQASSPSSEGEAGRRLAFIAARSDSTAEDNREYSKGASGLPEQVQDADGLQDNEAERVGSVEGREYGVLHDGDTEGDDEEEENEDEDEEKDEDEDEDEEEDEEEESDPDEDDDGLALEALDLDGY